MRLTTTGTVPVKVQFDLFAPASWSSAHALHALTARPSRQWSIADRRPGSQTGAITE